MNLVVDASIMVAALTDDTDDGEWAREQIGSNRLFAPQHLRVEVANVLRRMELRRQLTSSDARAAHADLLRRRIGLVRYGRHADRVWELRHNVTPYDACYIAVAEALELPLVTIDCRLINASGVDCEFLAPPTSGD